MDINDDEEIASEAYDLVEHSIQLIESKYFGNSNYEYYSTLENYNRSLGIGNW